VSRGIWARRAWRGVGAILVLWAALATIAPDYFTVTSAKVAQWSPILGAAISAAGSLIDLRFLFPVAFLWVFVYLWRLENRIEAVAVRAPTRDQPPPAFVPTSGALQALITRSKIPDTTRECGAEDMISDLDPEGIMRHFEAAPTDLLRKAFVEGYIGRCFTWDGRVERRLHSPRGILPTRPMTRMRGD
jgi:hypothetical protein